MNHVGEIILGLLGSSLFTLLWLKLGTSERRLERIETTMVTKDDLGRIDKTLMVIQGDLKQFYKDSGEIKGRVDELSRRVK
jgi:hypothetical protein